VGREAHVGPFTNPSGNDSHTAAILHIFNLSFSLSLSVTLPDEYRILVDMRWNKQYLDILANKCNFEDEERYMEFLEALNAVANRYAKRL